MDFLQKELKTYLSVLFHIVVFTFVIVTTTVVVHEYGHYFTGSAFGCTDAEIVLLDENFETYTKMDCNSVDANPLLLQLSGFLFIIPFSIALFMLSRYEKYHSFVVFGFNLIISSSDLSYAFASFNYVFMLLGAGLIVYGENLLVDRYISLIENQVISSSSNK